MQSNTSIRALFSQNPSPFSMYLPSRIPAASKPAPRPRPGKTNLRSFAFICGSFFEEAPDGKGADGINRMNRINPSTNPVNPVHPVHSSFSAAPKINRPIFINGWSAKNSSAPGDHTRFSCAHNGNEPVLSWNRTRMTLIKRTFTDSLIRANPRHPCSMAASLFAEGSGKIKIVEESISGDKNPEVQGHDGQA